MRIYRAIFASLCLFVCSSILSTTLNAQQPPRQLDAVDLERAHAILHQSYDEVRNRYYDPAYHGVNLDASFHQLDTTLNSSRTVNDSFRVIAAFLLQLHDSHTFFQPPQRVNHSTLGYDMEMVGDKCFVTHIRPGTDAATRLHVGDQVLAINHFAMKRADFSNMRYFFQTLSPAPAEMLELQSPAGERRQVTIQALLRPGKKLMTLDDGGLDGDYWQLVREDEQSEHMNRQRYYESGNLMVWKMPSFGVTPEDVESMFRRARKHQALVLDLRANPGGSEDTLKDMLAHVFDHDLKLADRVSRKDTKPLLVKTRHSTYDGKLIVLIDSGSASASELFARVLQLEKRGQVFGDQSAGAVMEAREYNETVGADPSVFYGLSITSANLLMTDGKSLENTGVIPDEKILPTAADLADGKDPVLAHAMKIAGVTMDPAAAGKLFPFEWPSL
jgi:C-terminal processing protease CtpA/Prc